MRARLAAVFITLALLLSAVGCGGNDLVVGGMLPATATPMTTPTPVCNPSGGGCSSDTQCCTGICLINGLCQ